MSDRACVRQIDVSAYVDGELSAEAAASLEGHLSNCEVCRETLQDFKGLREGFRVLAATPAPSRFVERTLARLNETSVWMAPLQRMERYLIAAILVLAIGAGYVMSKSVAVAEATVDTYFERLLDRETLEVTNLTETDLNKDQCLGLLLSTNSP